MNLTDTEFLLTNGIQPIEIDGWNSVCQICINNINVGLINMAFTLLSFGIISIIYLFYNGMILGLAVKQGLNLLSVNEIIGLTLPHSFEFLGFILWGQTALLLFENICLNGKNTNSRILLSFIVGLMIIVLAAVIEVYVSVS